MTAAAHVWPFCDDAPVTVERDGPFEEALARYEPHLRRVAWVLSGGDYQVMQDLLQGARIQLWLLDPARYDQSAQQQAYLRRAVVNGMYTMVRDAKARPEYRRVVQGGVAAPFSAGQRRYA
jgi:DNA-directed RNA polymerase specialized sigma24 family protein